MNLKELKFHYVGENEVTIKEWLDLRCLDRLRKTRGRSKHDRKSKAYYGHGRTYTWLDRDGTQCRFLHDTSFNRKLRNHPKNPNRMNFVFNQRGIVVHIWLG